MCYYYQMSGMGSLYSSVKLLCLPSLQHKVIIHHKYQMQEKHHTENMIFKGKYNSTQSTTLPRSVLGDICSPKVSLTRQTKPGNQFHWNTKTSFIEISHNNRTLQIRFCYTTFLFLQFSELGRYLHDSKCYLVLDFRNSNLFAKTMVPAYLYKGHLPYSLLTSSILQLGDVQKLSKHPL